MNCYFLAAGILLVLFAVGHFRWGQKNIFDELERRRTQGPDQTTFVSLYGMESNHFLYGAGRTRIGCSVFFPDSSGNRIAGLVYRSPTGRQLSDIHLLLLC